MRNIDRRFYLRGGLAATALDATGAYPDPALAAGGSSARSEQTSSLASPVKHDPLPVVPAAVKPVRSGGK